MLDPTKYPPLPVGFVWSYRTYSAAAGEDRNAVVAYCNEKDMASTWVAIISERLGGDGVSVCVAVHRGVEHRVSRLMSDEVIASRFIARWIELREQQIRRELRERFRVMWSGAWGAFRREPLPPPL